MLDYKDYAKWCNNLDKATRAYRPWLIDFMYKRLEELLTDIRKNTPVKTGALRDSWRIEKIEVRGDTIVGWFRNDQEYASHIEWGHAWPYWGGIAEEGDIQWVYGFWMMRTGLQKAYDELPAKYEKELQEFVRRHNIG